MLLEDYRIITECYADLLLVKTIGYVPNAIHGGFGEVARVMEKKYSNRLAIGVIDKFKGRTPNYFDDFREIESRHQLVLKAKRNSKHYLIFITAPIEDWIMYVGKLKEISRPYPNDDKRFYKEMKDSNVAKNATITSYFNTIKQRQSPPFSTLQEWLREILA